MKKTAIIIFTLVFGLTSFWTSSAGAGKKKVLYIDSYHLEYIWSADVTAGVKSVLADREDVELKIFRMDTKRNQSEEFKKAAALKAKKLIDSWQPDVVIASDDNASKYLIAPYYKGKDLPFVFCGLNWDASVYGFPARNVTGMVEVAQIPQILEVLKRYAKGDRIGFIGQDATTAKKEAKAFRRIFKLEMVERYAKTFREWKDHYRSLQRDADLLLIHNATGMKDWNQKEAEMLVLDYTTIPSGTSNLANARISLVSNIKFGEEQGEYAAKTALEILAGKSPKDIPVVKNKKAKIYLNMKLAKKMGIKFPMELIENVHLISAEQKKLFYVNSYHKGYQWSDDIEKGLLKALHIKAHPDGTFDTLQSEVELRVFRMDTKLNRSEALKKQAALSAKAIIDEWQPDIVVASDDNAAKYLIAPYYKNSAIPFVFSGLNWDASVYGFPTPNITGMVEVAPVLETIEMLKEYADGDRIGFIGSNTLSARKNVDNYINLLGVNFSDGKLVSTFDEWKKEYLRLQNTVDMILWLNPIGIKGWNTKLANDFILANTKIPTGGTSDNHVRFALLGRVKIAEEQGWWAGKTALRILAGTSQADIPVTTNKESRVYLNMQLAKQLGIKFPMELIEKATFLENQPD